MPEHLFQDKRSDFTALYMEVEKLSQVLDHEPGRASPQTLSFLAKVLKDKTHCRQTCAPFLYRQTAKALNRIMSRSPDPEMAERAWSILESFSLKNMGDTCLAASQALGTLPLNLTGPRLPDFSKQINKTLSWPTILDQTKITPGPAYWLGRSFLQKDNASKKILVLKLAREHDQICHLIEEAFWMQYLQIQSDSFSVRFDLPYPLSFGDNWIFSLNLDSLPQACPFQPHRKKTTLAYLVHSDYFIYINDPLMIDKFSQDQLLEIMSRNSYLLGHLSSQGILHTAPIPLFHNRTQENRRDDQGAYIWTRGGRLDRWYHSSLYPNFGLSGLRDFEHLKSHQANSQELFREIGNQFLSLFLVTASYFRSLKPEKMGLDAQNKPIDSRCLFDPNLLEELIKEIFINYYRGFVQSDFPSQLPENLRSLVHRMIEEMGVDRHMTEILRIEDQQSMNDQDFYAFLINRGLESGLARKYQKGVQEITLYTGPHLGGFNQRISLPELIDFTAGATAACISSKFMQDQTCCII